MSKGHKRIVLILIGVLLTAGSLIWMTYSTSKKSPDSCHHFLHRGNCYSWNYQGNDV